MEEILQAAGAISSIVQLFRNPVARLFWEKSNWWLYDQDPGEPDSSEHGEGTLMKSRPNKHGHRRVKITVTRYKHLDGSSDDPRLPIYYDYEGYFAGDSHMLLIWTSRGRSLVGTVTYEHTDEYLTTLHGRTSYYTKKAGLVTGNTWLKKKPT